MLRVHGSLRLLADLHHGVTYFTCCRGLTKSTECDDNTWQMACLSYGTVHNVVHLGCEARGVLLQLRALFAQLRRLVGDSQQLRRPLLQRLTAVRQLLAQPLDARRRQPRRQLRAAG